MLIIGYTLGNGELRKPVYSFMVVLVPGISKMSTTKRGVLLRIELRDLATWASNVLIGRMQAANQAVES